MLPQPQCHGWKYLKALDVLSDTGEVDAEVLAESVSDMLDNNFSKAVSGILETCGERLAAGGTDLCPPPQVKRVILPFIWGFLSSSCQSGFFLSFLSHPAIHPDVIQLYGVILPSCHPAILISSLCHSPLQEPVEGEEHCRSQCLVNDECQFGEICCKYGRCHLAY